jgi:hypothetical protein
MDDVILPSQSFPADIDRPAIISSKRTVNVNGFLRLPPIRALTSMKLSVVLLVIFALAIAKATFLESQWGAVGARDMVYSARWFEIVLALLIVNLTLVLFARAPYKPRQYGSVVIHVAVIWILIAAGVTRYLGYEGIMPIREGTSTDHMFSREPHVQLEIDGETASFPVRLYRPGTTGIRRNLDGYSVAVEQYWPRFAESLQASDTGPAALRLTLSGDGGVEEVFLIEDERRTFGGLAMRYENGPLPESAGGSQWGRLRMHSGGASMTFDVPDALPETFENEGWRFTVTEFQADFKVGGGTDYSGELRNPMVRVEVAAPDGREGEKILFAFHPEFSMSHSGAEEDFPELDILYQFERGVTFGRDEAGALVARASQPLESMGMSDDAEPVDIAAGQAFTIDTETVYRGEGGGPAFMLREALDHVQALPAMTNDERAPAAARISVTDASGAHAEAIVIQGDDRGESVMLGDQRAVLRFGSIVIDLPYAIHLDDFLLLNYPGSRNPASYESHVRVFDPEQGIDGEPVRIYMNHPLTHRGYKHFQSSYDPDEMGTVLSVNYDPGTIPTYVGYGLLTLGFLLLLLRDLLWPARKPETEGRTS